MASHPVERRVAWKSATTDRIVSSNGADAELKVSHPVTIDGKLNCLMK
jgi:hypothetical protein